MSLDERLERRMGGPVTPVAHGRWSLEVRGDEVADVRFDGVLLLRAVRPVVRDRDWNTVPVEVLERFWPDGRTLETRLAWSAQGIGYAATLRVRLSEEELVVDFDGQATTDFERNRIGLVVLHPAADAGRPVEVQHTAGDSTSAQWPSAISPHQPFTDVAGFAWSRSGVTAELALTGDVFETEDQRNWTDASFKTYSTPLSRPFPVAVGTGERCHQQARLRAGGRCTTQRPTQPEEVTVAAGVVGSVPPIALGAALYPPPTLKVTGWPVGYEAVLVELTGNEEDWPDLVNAAAQQADALGAGLDVRVVTTDPGAVRRVVGGLSELPVLRLGAFDPENHLSTAVLWAALQDAAREQRLPAALLGGTRAHFTELNRAQGQLPVDLTAVTFSLTPTMHATEVPHLLDSLSTQRTVVENALRIAAGRPLHVGPVTLARRFNAVATTPRPTPAVEAARATDPLQDTDLAGSWTLASVAALAVPGVASLCYFETVGPRGARRADGTPTAAGALLDQVAALRGRPVHTASGPEGLAVLAVGQDDVLLVLLGNLTPRPRTVRVVGTGGPASVVDLAPWQCQSVSLGGSR